MRKLKIIKKLLFSFVLIAVCFLFCSFYKSIAKEKQYVNVSIDQEFSTNSICILMNHKESMKIKDFVYEDFKEVNPDEVLDDDPYTYEYIVKYLNGEQIDTSTIKVKNFRRNLLLKWKEKKTKEEIIEIIKILEKREDIYLVQPNYYYELQSTTPNDIDTNYLNYYQLHDVNKAWDYTTGAHSVKVGIIDSGIDGTHPDLVNNLDNNLHKDFCNQNEQPLVDNYGHGTCVAGIIGARGNNNLGISGICWDVSLISLKVSDVHNGIVDSFIPSSYVKSAVTYANTNNIKILNFSGHLVDTNNVPVNDVYLYNAISNYNGLFICSAGNCPGHIGTTGYNDLDYNNDNHDFFPGNYSTTLSNVISVGGCDDLNKRSNKSHYGENTVTLFASYYAYSTTIDAYRYNYFNGTSASAPMVSATAALLYSMIHTLSTSSIKSIILNSCDDLNVIYYSGTTELSYIGKKLNVYKAVKQALNLNLNNITTHIIQNTSYNDFCETTILSNNNSNYPNKKFYKINVIDNATYIFRIDNSITVNISIYDSNLNKLSINNCNSIEQVRVFKNLDIGIYYIKVESFYSLSDNITLNIERQFNQYLNYNINNHFNNSGIGALNIRYENNQLSGYYSISFVPLSPIGTILYEIPNNMCEIYSDDERTNLLLYTTQNNNNLIMYMDYNTKYYFDIEYNIGDLSGFDIIITPVS